MPSCRDKPGSKAVDGNEITSVGRDIAACDQPWSLDVALFLPDAHLHEGCSEAVCLLDAVQRRLLVKNFWQESLVASVILVHV